MRRTIAGLVVLASALAGCGKAPFAPPGGPQHGRFVGIGIFDAGRLWAQMVAPASADAAAATIADDDHIIVVTDSDTGEVRECGNHSGYCVSMNPWTKAVGGTKKLPVAFAKHAADLAKEDDEAKAADVNQMEDASTNRN